MPTWTPLDGSYYDQTLKSDTWTLPAGPRQEARYWREPSPTCAAAATDSGLLIERLLEPPRETMRARSPEDDAKLHAQPGLLVLRLHAAT